MRVKILTVIVVSVGCVSGWGLGGFFEDLESTENSIFYKKTENVENAEIIEKFTENDISGSGDFSQTDTKTENMIFINDSPTQTPILSPKTLVLPPKTVVSPPKTLVLSAKTVVPPKTSNQLKTDINTVFTDITHPETSAYDCEDGYSVNPNNNKIIQLWTRLRYCSGVNIDSKYFSARLSLENKYRKSANPFRGYWSDAKVHSGYEFESLVSLNIPYVGNVTIKVDQLIGTTGLVGFKGGVKMGYESSFLGQKYFEVRNDLTMEVNYKKDNSVETKTMLIENNEIEILEGSGEMSKFGRSGPSEGSGQQTSSVPTQKLSLNGMVQIIENINVILIPGKFKKFHLDVGLQTKSCVGMDVDRYLQSPCEVSLYFNDTEAGVLDLYGRVGENFVRFGIRDESDGANGIEFLSKYNQETNDTDIEISYFLNNGGIDKMNVLNLASDGIIMQTFDDFVGYVEKKHSTQNSTLVLDLTNVDDLIFLTSELDSYISDRFSEFLTNTVLEAYGVSIEFFTDAFKSIGQWIKNSLEQWKNQFKVNHAIRKKNFLNGVGRMSSGMKWAGAKSWNGTRWMGQQGWQGSKWVAGKTWNGTKSLFG